MDDYYKVMSLARSSTTSEIKARYKSLAKKYHPDRAGDNLRMSQLNTAYETLSNPRRRYEYNQKLAAAVGQDPSQPSSDNRRHAASPFQSGASDSSSRLPSLRFSPFRSVSFVAIIIIILALAGGTILLHDTSNTVALNPSPASSSQSDGGNTNGQTLTLSPSAPTNTPSSSTATSNLTQLSTLPTNVYSWIGLTGSNVISRVRRDLTEGRSTVQACETERSAMSQQIAAIDQQINATENAMSNLASSQTGVSAKFAQYQQLEQQLSSYQRELHTIETTDTTLC